MKHLFGLTSSKILLCEQALKSYTNGYCIYNNEWGINILCYQAFLNFKPKKCVKNQQAIFG